MVVFDRGLGGDGWASFATLESWLEDGDVWVEDDLRGVRNGLVPVVVDGESHLVMQYPPGVLAFDLVPALLGRAIVRVAIAFGAAGDQAVDVQPVGGMEPEAAGAVAGIVVGRNVQVLLGLLILWFALGEIDRTRRSRTIAVAATFFGGPLVFYALVGMSHVPAFLLLSCLLLLSMRSWRDRPGRALLAGGVLGMAVLVRFGALAVLPACAVHLALSRSRLREWAAFTCGVSACLATLPFWWWFQTGRWFPPGYGGAWEPTLLAPVRILLSPHHGLFVFHPATVLAVAGLALAAGRRHRWAVTAWVWLAGVVVLNGGWSEWANSGGWGQRFLIDALPVLALGFLELLHLEPVWPQIVARSATAAALVAGYLFFFGAVSGLANRPDPHPWPQRPADYSALVRSPPRPRELSIGLCRASFSLRLIGLCPHTETAPR